MNIDEQFRVNKPHVVHDTIEGETIIVNLKNGNYYSFDKTGVVIWEVLIHQGDLNFLAGCLSALDGELTEPTEHIISTFIAGLLKERLLVALEENEETGTRMSQEEIKGLVDKLGSRFEAPVLNKYAEMQDMLLLDPIHDTDEQGWPQAMTD